MHPKFSLIFIPTTQNPYFAMLIAFPCRDNLIPTEIITNLKVGVTFSENLRCIVIESYDMS